MSNEEIIHAWKKEPSSKITPSHEEAEAPAGKPPDNPAGANEELSDEELALIEGGDGSSLYCTQGCPPIRPR